MKYKKHNKTNKKLLVNEISTDSPSQNAKPKNISAEDLLQLIAEKKRSRRAELSSLGSAINLKQPSMHHLQAITDWLAQLGGGTKEQRAAIVASTMTMARDLLSVPLDDSLMSSLKACSERFSKENLTFSEFGEFTYLDDYYRQKELGDAGFGPLGSIGLGIGGTCDLVGAGSMIGGFVTLDGELFFEGLVTAIVGAVITYEIVQDGKKQRENESQIKKEINAYYSQYPDKNYYESALDIAFIHIKNKLAKIEDQLCKALNIDQAYIQLEIRSSERAHELAITLDPKKNFAPTGKIYTLAVDKNTGTQTDAAQLLFDQDSNTLNLAGQKKRLLSLATLTSYIAKETRTLSKGTSFWDRDEVKMSLDLKDQLTINNTGTGNLTVDIGQLTHIYYGQDDARATLAFEINLGAADGTAYLNAGTTTVNGDSRYLNHVNYSHIRGDTKLTIRADSAKPYHYTVDKQVNAKLWVEKYQRNSFQRHWKRNPIVETRIFSQQQESYTATDTLNNIQLITCSSAGTIFQGNNENESISLGAGDDDIKMGVDMTSLCKAL